MLEPSSFRDNRGFVFWQDGQPFRQINSEGYAAYDHLMSSGLYQALVEQQLLIPHAEVKPTTNKNAHRIIRPELIPFISYPYEWSFSQLKDAALATLAIQKLALKHGMTLRDASAYNIQFRNGKPCLIDTLSFDTYHPGEPWQAYRQFCQHFVAPLALMHYRDVDLSQLLRIHIDGIPLPLTQKLLPAKAKLRGGLIVHIGLHARLQRQHQSDGTKPKAPSRAVSENALRGIVDSLERTIQSLRPPKADTEWADYYSNTNYQDSSFKQKGQLIERFVNKLKPMRILDLGANNGTFSRIAGHSGAFLISCDIDPMAVEDNYRQVKVHGETGLLPLLIDLTNPSPALGWANTERQDFGDRATADVVMALALVHHLAISHNLPLELIASYLAQLGPTLIIEFVPKTDSQVQILLASREDIFPSYTTDGFESAFGQFYTTTEKVSVPGSERTLYLMKRRSQATKYAQT